jgi:hypothetical protein
MRSTLIGTALLALTGTSAFGQEVSYDFDKSADFAGLHSYVWTAGARNNEDFNHQRIVSAIDAQLAAKGLRPAVRADADVVVAYHVLFTQDLEVRGSASGWGGYRAGPSHIGSARVERIVVATLVVDLLDAKTGTLLWRGIARKELDERATPEKRDRNINEAAAKLFKHYPPEA